MQIRNKSNYTKRSLFTRQCIGDALLALMEEMPYEQISISDICKKAGISRMTFYHYFYTKTDAVNDYIYEIFASASLYKLGFFLSVMRSFDTEEAPETACGFCYAFIHCSTLPCLYCKDFSSNCRYFAFTLFRFADYPLYF